MEDITSTQMDGEAILLNYTASYQLDSFTTPGTTKQTSVRKPHESYRTSEGTTAINPSRELVATFNPYL